MSIYTRNGNRYFAGAVVLVCSVFIVLVFGADKNMDLSFGYLLVGAYLLWMKGRGRHYFVLGALISGLMLFGFFITERPGARSSTAYYNLTIMLILVWVVIYFIYRQNKLLEREVKNSRQLDAMFENATQGILSVDNLGKILILNKFAERLFGYGRNELIGQPVEKLIPERFAHPHTCHRKNYHENPHNRAMGSGMELYALRKGGQEFPVEVSLGFYLVEGIQTIILFVTDITERNKINRQLILEKEMSVKLNAELEARVRERTRKLEEALQNLEKSNSSLREIEKELKNALSKERELGELKSRFVTMASHEFRTPLTTILSSVFLLENSKEEDRERIRNVHFGRIKSAAKNQAAILDDFLSLSKLEEGFVKPSYRLTVIETLTHEVIEEINTLKKAGQKIIYLHSGNTEAQVIDRQFLRNIVINILSNAIKFSPQDCRIDLMTKVDANQLTITVADRGIGIPLEEQQHIFTRFFRAGNAQNIDGTGLGLNIVKKYVDLMRGNIVFESGVNEGTTIIINIPIIQNSDVTKRVVSQ